MSGVPYPRMAGCDVDLYVQLTSLRLEYRVPLCPSQSFCPCPKDRGCVAKPWAVQDPDACNRELVNYSAESAGSSLSEISVVETTYSPLLQPMASVDLFFAHLMTCM